MKAIPILSRVVYFILFVFLSASTSQSLALGAELKVLTYNIWGLSFNIGPFPTIHFARDVDLRIPRICNALREGSWDVVFLQEVWRPSDRKLFKSCGYPYSVDLDERRCLGIPDSGLMILSRFPLEDEERLKFSKNGSLFWPPTLNGELLVGKSGIYARMIHPEIGDVWLANAHLVSGHPDGSHYDLQRRSQFIDFARHAVTLAKGLPIILGGDFNFNIAPQNSSHPDLDEIVDQLPTILPGFSRLHTQDVCSHCSSNAWNQDGGEGLIDILYGSSHFRAIQGGIRFRDSFESYYFSPDYGVRHLSDHYGWETTFDN